MYYIYYMYTKITGALDVVALADHRRVRAVRGAEPAHVLISHTVFTKWLFSSQFTHTPVNLIIYQGIVKDKSTMLLVK